MSRDVTPVSCPIEGCDFEDPLRSVAAHVSRSEEPAHSWDRLEYDGTQSFVRAETGTTRADEDDGAASGGSSADAAGSSPADTGTTAGPVETSPVDIDSPASGAGDGSPPGDTDASDPADAADADEDTLELSFVREAAAIESLLERYEAADLSELDPFRLANLYVLLAAVADAADEARVAVRDELLARVQDDRTIEADVGEVSRQTAQRRHLRDEETVRERLEAAGVEPVEAMRLDRGRVADAIANADVDPEEVFETEERASIRRIDVDEAAVRELVESLEDDVASR